jgi:hypothetical protein
MAVCANCYQKIPFAGYNVPPATLVSIYSRPSSHHSATTLVSQLLIFPRYLHPPSSESISSSFQALFKKTCAPISYIYINVHIGLVEIVDRQT